MGTTDNRIDQYIKKSAAFAQPVLIHLRKLVHAACPGVEETIKWSFPHFIYKDQILCSMAAFKNHCSFGFWKASIMPDPEQLMETVGKTGMGHLGQITSLSDLPSDALLKKYIKVAVKLNDEGITVAKPKPRSTPKELVIPDYIVKALKKNKAALKTFESFSYSNKKDYVDWITEAKTEETRSKRLETAVEWMAEGKIRNWKYSR